MISATVVAIIIIICGTAAGVWLTSRLLPYSDDNER